MIQDYHKSIFKDYLFTFSCRHADVMSCDCFDKIFFPVQSGGECEVGLLPTLRASPLQGRQLCTPPQQQQLCTPPQQQQLYTPPQQQQLLSRRLYLAIVFIPEKRLAIGAATVEQSRT